MTRSVDAYWGHTAGNPYIDLINAMPKYVASRSLTEATISASITIKALAEAIFAVLVDPAKHAAMDGPGWVRDPVDGQLLTASGQIFRMGMYHANHPNGNYEMANRVQVFDPPHAISWEPGYDPGDGNLLFGGWIWRYDLAPLGPSDTEVRLSYDWSAARYRAKTPAALLSPRSVASRSGNHQFGEAGQRIVQVIGGERWKLALSAHHLGTDLRGHAHAIQVLTVTDAGIAHIVTFQQPGLFPAFGLPPTQPAAAGAAEPRP